MRPTPPFTVFNFTGIVISEDNFATQLTPGINVAKNNNIARLGGQAVNLHFHPLAKRKEIFCSLTKQEEIGMWVSIIDLLKSTDYNVMAGIVKQQKYQQLYPQFQVDLPVLAFKILLQNFARYLYLNNGYGKVVVESSTSDESLREEYYRLRFAGSKYITPNGYQQVFRGIEFISKESLNEGLQTVDFIANPVSRLVCAMNPFRPRGFSQSPYPDILSAKIFKGPTNKPMEFGVRTIF